jgi:hypothetical protein
MDRRIEQPTATPERRRVVAAWELLERAEALLPRNHPAAWHLAQALAAMKAEWREHRTSPDAAHATAHL